MEKKADGNCRGGARQKVTGYLGKVYEFQRINNNDIITHLGIKNIKDYFEKFSIGQVVRDLVRLELLNHNFYANKDFYVNGDIKVYIGNNDFFINKGKKIVLSMNEGFLCKETFNRLINFKPKGSEEEIGLKLANALVETGLKVPEEVFISICEKYF